MARIIKLNEDDLKSFLEPALHSAGFLHEGQSIDGFLYTTRKIKKDGDYYKDVITDPNDTSEAEEVKFVKVIVKNERRTSEDEG
jgi:hypothetical protein